MSPRVFFTAALALHLFAQAAPAQFTYDEFQPLSESITFYRGYQGKLHVEVSHRRRLPRGYRYLPRSFESRTRPPERHNLLLENEHAYRGFQFEVTGTEQVPILKVQRSSWRHQLRLMETVEIFNADGLLTAPDGAEYVLWPGATFTDRGRKYEARDFTESKAVLVDLEQNRESTVPLSQIGRLRLDHEDLRISAGVQMMHHYRAMRELRIDGLNMLGWCSLLLFHLTLVYGCILLEYLGQRAIYPKVPRWERHWRRKGRA